MDRITCPGLPDRESSIIKRSAGWIVWGLAYDIRTNQDCLLAANRRTELWAQSPVGRPNRRKSFLLTSVPNLISNGVEHPLVFRNLKEHVKPTITWVWFMLVIPLAASVILSSRRSEENVAMKDRADIKTEHAIARVTIVKQASL
ncbi:hypothetical protein K503DRAFT_782813 [Rhizopogon vinicolor AM-OR11-026]|uniref:Uncharacterized protein n=1 Tax=Rhizopogon vinicolor AM-OR11-026 TaxID=1314800 RepID=A0A1B7N0Z8_9AGAM|nr:hypothetical protein K503DRAFT_782813 [Rhizopogon vinicolor AM-OR11-026]